MELQNRPDLQLLAKYTALVPDHATIVEIGTHLGDTALIMANAAPWAIIYTIDTGDRWVWEGRDIDDYESFLWDRWGAEEIYFLRGDSRYVSWEGDIDLLFIDGDHSYDAVMSDLIRWAPMVRPNGYMLLHDYIIGETDKVYGALRDYNEAHQEWYIEEIIDTMIACQRNQ